MISQFGKEGVHFTWSGEPGQLEAEPRAARGGGGEPPGRAVLGRFFHYPYGYHADMIRWIYNPQFVRIWDNWFNPGNSRVLPHRPYKWDLFAETDMKVVAERYGEGLNTIANEFYLRVVTGQSDLDAEWDAYVERYMAEGGEQALAAMQSAVIIPALHEGRIEY